MKTIFYHFTVVTLLGVFLFSSLTTDAAVRTSLTSGSWDDPATWDCSCTPASTDDIVISAATKVVLGSTTSLNNLTIHSTALLYNNGYVITINGNYTNNGDHVGNNRTEIAGSGAMINGSGTIHAAELRLENGPKFILSSANMTKAFGSVSIKTGVTVTNFGTFTVGGSLEGEDATSTWINSASSTLNVGGNLLLVGTLTASASDNVVKYFSITPQEIKTTSDASYYHLSIEAAGTKKITDSVTVLGNLTNSSQLEFDGYNIYLLGDWDNTGTLLTGTGGLYLTGGSDQALNSFEGDRFYKLVINKAGGTVYANSNDTVTDILGMYAGNIDMGTNRLSLGIDSLTPGTLYYSGGSILGEFSRQIYSMNTYDFPLGVSSSSRLASASVMIFTGGELVGSFVESDPTITGLPIWDATDSLHNTLSDGYWVFEPLGGFSSSMFDLNLTGDGFTSFPIIANTRILKRSSSSNPWSTDGFHDAAVGNIVKRTTLSSFAEFALADTTDCLIPTTNSISGTDSVCFNTSGVGYSVPFNIGSTYNWTVTGGTIANGQGTDTITVNWGLMGLYGRVEAIETNSCTNGSTMSMDIDVHPLPSEGLTGKQIVSEGTIGEMYTLTSRPGYSYTWSVVGGTLVGGQGTSTIVVDWTNSGTGSVCVVGSNSCGSAVDLCLAVIVYVPINSSQTGDYDDINTWNCYCVPLSSSDVKIKSTHTVTITDADHTVHHFEIEAGGVFVDGGYNMEASGDFTLDGSYVGSGDLTLSGSSANIDGTGQLGSSGDLHITGGDKTVLSTAYISKTIGTTRILGGFTITNYGHVTLDGGVVGIMNTSKWINEADSYLSSGDSLLNSKGKLFATANDNEVVYNGTGMQGVNIAQTSAYEVLTMDKPSGTAILEDDITINDNLNLQNGIIVLGSQNVIISNSATSTGGSVNSYVQADSSGVYRKKFNTSTPFFFAVGDVDEYSPMTVTNNSSGGGSCDVNLVDAKESNVVATGYVTRYWNVSFPSTDFDVSYIYQDADIVGDETSYYTQVWNGSSWNQYEKVDTNNNRLYTATGLSGASNWHLTGFGGAALPLDLLTFEAIPATDHVALKWVTSNEINTDHFLVQRSLDGHEFHTIKQVTAAGYSYSPTSYGAIDHAPLKGTSYYRLKQMDVDGEFSLSDIVPVHFNEEGLGFRIYPNPVQIGEEMRVDLRAFENEEEIMIAVLDHMGRKVFSTILSSGEEHIIPPFDKDLDLATGMYYVVASGNYKMYQDKLIITNGDKKTTYIIK